MPASPAAARRRPHVVVVGGGFGGIAAAKALRRADVDVTLVDRTNHHLFQPLLYQVATAVLSPADVASPVRVVLKRQRNATVRLAEVVAVEAARKTLVIDEGGLRREIAYDFLILAPGARHAYFGRPEWEAHAPGLKSLDDARRIRTRMLRAFERAFSTDDPAGRAAWLTFVVVGAGPTGVELAGILPAIASEALRRDRRAAGHPRARIVLVEAGERVLSAFDADLSARATLDLAALGVEVRTSTRVTDVDATGVTLDAGDGRPQRLDARTVVWAAGNAAAPVLATLGAELDRAGRVIVAPDLSIPAHPDVFVVGDAAAAPLVPGEDVRAGAALVPGVAQGAMQGGTHAARTILRRLSGEGPLPPFRYRDKGNLAVVGRGRAIADVAGLHLTGFVAWLFWLFLHVLLLAGFRNRAVVLVSWAYSFVTYQPGAGLLRDDEAPAVAAPAVVARVSEATTVEAPGTGPAGVDGRIRAPVRTDASDAIGAVAPDLAGD